MLLMSKIGSLTKLTSLHFGGIGWDLLVMQFVVMLNLPQDAAQQIR